MIVEMLKMPSVSWMVCNFSILLYGTEIFFIATCLLYYDKVKMDGGWRFHGEAEEETIRGIVLQGLT